MNEDKYIRCKDSDDLIELMHEYEVEGYDTDFCYEKDGVKGFWLEVKGNKGENTMTRTEILAEAEKCVCSDRNLQYGEPEDNFNTIAKFWSAFLDTEIAAWQVAAMMMLMKNARIKSSKGRDKDSWVDAAGYSACGCELGLKEDN